MPDFRAHGGPSELAQDEIRLSSCESHHLVAVNRARRGDPVVVFNGQGTEWDCDLTSADKHEAVLKVRAVRQAPPLAFEITLAQALPKGSGMDDIVRKATEIGVACIVPLESERTQVHLEGDRSGRKIEKWRTTALEAAKQCGNPWLPEIQGLQTAAAFMAAARNYDLKLIASLHPGAKSLKAVLAAFTAAQGRPPRKVLWLIGPEGDLSPAELQVAVNAGFEPITLGPRVLRCETAALYALSVLNHELQP